MIMKKIMLVYVISLVAALTLSAVVVSIFISRTDKKREDFFVERQQPVAEKIIDRCFSNTISVKSEEKKAKQEEMYGGPLSDEKRNKQFKTMLSSYASGLNCISEVTDTENTGKLYSTYYFYDSEMNSIMFENTLILVRTEKIEDKKVRILYSFQDDEFARKMRELRENVGDNYEYVGFHIDNAYIKDDTFVPAKMSYYAQDSNGKKSKEYELYTNASDKEAMIYNGYQFCEVANDFTFGDSIVSDKDNAYFVTYIGEVDKKVKDRIDELLQEGQKTHPDEKNYIITKRTGFYQNEIFSFNTYGTDDSEHIYHGVIYDYSNSAASLLDTVTIPGAGFGDLIFLFVGIIASFVIPLVLAVLYLKPKYKKQDIKAG